MRRAAGGEDAGDQDRDDGSTPAQVPARGGAVHRLLIIA